MRNETVEIADREGHTFRMSISTPRFFGRVLDLVRGESVDVDLKMTGLKKDDGVTGHIGISRAIEGGAWRVVDKSYLRYKGGKTFSRYAEAGTTRDLILLNMDGTWGMKLWEYEDATGVNAAGSGSVIQPWVMGFQPGKFSWVVV